MIRTLPAARRASRTFCLLGVPLLRLEPARLPTCAIFEKPIYFIKHAGLVMAAHLSLRHCGQVGIPPIQLAIDPQPCTSVFALGALLD